MTKLGSVSIVSDRSDMTALHVLCSMFVCNLDFWMASLFWQKNSGMRQAFLEAYVDTAGY
jgi:hypothetical protein